MSEERKADMEGMLAELEYEIALAIKQGVMPKGFQWTAAVDSMIPDGNVAASPTKPWIVLLTVSEVA
jgi:hypothetical protein